MIIRILDSKNRLTQSLLFFAMISAAVIPVIFRGITVHIPEESSMYYHVIATFVSNLSETWQAVIVTVIFLIVGTGLFSLMSGLGLIQSRQSAFPVFFAIIALVAFPETIGFHPPLVAMLFLVPAVHNIIRTGTVKKPDIKIFNAGLLVSLSSLIAFPILFFVPAFYMVLVIFRLYKRSHWGMLSAGILIPWLYSFMFGWVFNWWPAGNFYSLAGIWLSGIIYFFQYMGSYFTALHFLLLSMMVVFLIVSFFSVYSRLDQMVFSVRYLFRALLWLGIPGIPVILVAGGMIIQYMMVFGFFLTIVGTSYLVSVRKKKMINILLLLIVIIIISCHLQYL